MRVTIECVVWKNYRLSNLLYNGNILELTLFSLDKPTETITLENVIPGKIESLDSCKTGRNNFHVNTK